MSSTRDLLEEHFEGLFKDLKPAERLQARVNLGLAIKTLEESGAVVRLSYKTGRALEDGNIVHEVLTETSSFIGNTPPPSATVWKTACGVELGSSTEPVPGVEGGVVTCLRCLAS